MMSRDKVDFVVTVVTQQIVSVNPADAFAGFNKKLRSPDSRLRRLNSHEKQGRLVLFEAMSPGGMVIVGREGE